jgi:hypothetical protein
MKEKIKKERESKTESGEGKICVRRKYQHIE